MYEVTIEGLESMIVEDFAVVNLNGDKTLYIRLMDGKELGYKINDKSVEVMLVTK